MEDQCHFGKPENGDQIGINEDESGINDDEMGIYEVLSFECDEVVWGFAISDEEPVEAGFNPVVSLID